jgi:tRNA threonylcarbamoyladenosine biosynthesis protein TsaE
MTKRLAVLAEPALEAWGRSVGEAVAAGGAGSRPLILALRGSLGAGKSVLARAVARGAGVASPMPSPTYNLLFTYAGAGGLEVHHLDLYRLEHPDDVWELGWEELGVGDQVVLIEWPERVESLLPADRWDISLEFATAVDPSTDPLRRVHLTRDGEAPDLPPLPVDSAPEVGP